MVKKLIPFGVVILFAVLSGFPLLHTGLHPTHDGEYHIIRFYEFFKVLESGVFYPRWAPDLNNGFGVPLFNFVYPLPNYIAAFFHFFGMSFIDAFKYQMFFGGIIGAIFFYLWTKKYFGTRGGIVSSVFYTYSPYHFLDVYVRGSVGEVWTLALFPGFFFFYDAYIASVKVKYLLFTSVILALIIFSHNILSMVFLPFGFSYMLFWYHQKKGNLRSIFLIILFSFSISSIFWVPAILEKHLVKGLQIYSATSEFPELYELIIPSWGTNFLATDPGNKMSFQIGIGNILVVFLSVFTLFSLLKKRDKKAPIILYFICMFTIFLFLILKFSLPLWNIFSLIQYIQFPWRLLIFEIFIASFLAGSIFLRNNSTLLAVFMIGIVVLLGSSYTKPAYYHQRDDDYYVSRPNFIDGTNSPGNLFNTNWFDVALKKKNQKIEGENLVIKKQEIKPSAYSFQAELKENSKITVNTAYFPGWSVDVDGKAVVIERTKHGLFSFEAPRGDHSIKISFQETPVRMISTGITLTTAFLIISLLLLSRSAKIKV